MISSYRNDNRNTGIVENSNRSYSVGTNAVQVLSNDTNIKGWAGQNINIVLKALDELEHPTGTVMQFILVIKAIIFILGLYPRILML